VEICKRFSFEAAHRLPNVPAGHKCSRLHGHSFHLKVCVAGEPDERSGWIVDFGEIKKAVRPILEQLDHRYLNEIAGLENPTSENLVRWIWQRLAPVLPGLSKLVIKETPSSSCSYRGPQDGEGGP
jgi:6-pyruvoyltetrahydropterin/6-carboxytetrahydropterin synthase